MPEDMLLLSIPKFKVSYDGKTYSHRRQKEKNKLNDALYSASRQYCMYCYTRIQIDQKRAGQLEHAIEKVISKNKLTDCIPNIGLSCVICNDKYKRYHERMRYPDRDAVLKFERDAKCGDACTTECQAYKELKRAYLGKEESHIILQPAGVSYR